MSPSGRIAPPSEVESEDRYSLSRSPSPAPFELREYQKVWIDKCLAALASGQKRIGLSAPTGAGKTAIITALIPRLPQSRSWWARSRVKVLVIVPTRELVSQVVNTIKGLYSDCGHVGIEQGSTEASVHDSIIFATWQTLQRKGRLDRFPQQEFKAIITDEAHGDAADRLLGILHYFNEDVTPPPGTKLFAKKGHGHKVPIIGLSATFARTDSRRLGWVFEDVVYHLDLEELLEQKYLCRARWIHLWPELEKLTSTQAVPAAAANNDKANASPKAKDKSEADDEIVVKKEFQLSTGQNDEPLFAPPTKAMLKAARDARFTDFVVESYRKHASDRRFILIFCATLKSVKAIVDCFRSKGFKADSVSSKTPDDKRKKTFEAFRKGALAILVNCFLLAEVIDVPKIDAVFIARPCQSVNMWSQMTGRGLRTCAETGKTDCLVVSFFDGWSKLTLGVKPKLD